MSWRAKDVVPIGEARVRPTGLADDPVLQAAHAGLVLVQGALEGLEDLAAGRLLDEAEFDRALVPVRRGPRANKT